MRVRATSNERFASSMDTRRQQQQIPDLTRRFTVGYKKASFYGLELRTVKSIIVLNSVNSANGPKLDDDSDVELHVLGCRVDILGTN